MVTAKHRKKVQRLLVQDIMIFTRRIDRRGYHPRLRVLEVRIKGFESLCAIFGGELEGLQFSRSQSHDLCNTGHLHIRPEIDNISFTLYEAHSKIFG
jgi:hypothetical protein